MNFAVLAPFIRVQVFGAVVWALAKLGLPAAQADAYTDWTMAGLALLASTGYGAYAAWRERKAGIVARAAALPEVAKIVTTPEIASKVEDPAVTTRG